MIILQKGLHSSDNSPCIFYFFIIEQIPISETIFVRPFLDKRATVGRQPQASPEQSHLVPARDQRTCQKSQEITGQ